MYKRALEHRSDKLCIGRYNTEDKKDGNWVTRNARVTNMYKQKYRMFEEDL